MGLPCIRKFRKVEDMNTVDDHRLQSSTHRPGSRRSGLLRLTPCLLLPSSPPIPSSSSSSVHGGAKSRKSNISFSGQKRSASSRHTPSTGPWKDRCVHRQRTTPPSRRTSCTAPQVTQTDTTDSHDQLRKGAYRAGQIPQTRHTEGLGGVRVCISMRRHALTKNKIGIARPNVNYTIRTVDENPTSPYVDDCVVLLSLSLAEHGQHARRREVTQGPPVHQPVSPHTRHMEGYMYSIAGMNRQ